MPAERKAKQSRWLTVAGLIGVSAATLLMMAWAVFPTPAFANGTLNWAPDMHGADNLPCTSGAHWVFTPGGQDTVTAATLTVNGTAYTMQQSGNGSWSADSIGPLAVGGVTASVSFTGDLGSNAGLQLSHCSEGTPSTSTTTMSSTTPTSTSSTTATSTSSTTATSTSSTTATSTSSTTATSTSSTTAPGGGGGGTTSIAPTLTTSSSATVGPTTVHPSKSETETVSPTTVQPGKLAFTGFEDVVPIGALALTLMTTGSGLLWAGARRRRSADSEDED